MACKLLPCTCTGKPCTAYQDSAHGKGQRVHNEMAKGYRCTCCGRVTETKRAKDDAAT